MKIGDTKASTRKLRTAYRRMGDREPERGGDTQDTAKSQLTETPKSINQTRIRAGGEGGTPYTRAFGRGKETKANARGPATLDSWRVGSGFWTRGSQLGDRDSGLGAPGSGVASPASRRRSRDSGLPRSVPVGRSREALTTYVFVLGHRRVSGYTLPVCGPLQAKEKKIPGGFEPLGARWLRPGTAYLPRGKTLASVKTPKRSAGPNTMNGEYARAGAHELAKCRAPCPLKR